jgi:penicillin-binding protein 1A
VELPRNRPRGSTPQIGRLITDFGLERRTVVPLDQMAPAVRAAFVVTEDKRFYRHHGVDLIRVLGAIKNNILQFRVAEGFSTITMQLARNLWPENISGRDRSLSRKIREAQVAFEIEKNYSKDRIPRAVSEPDRAGERCLRRRGGLPALLRQVSQRPERRGSGAAGRAAQGAILLQSAQVSGPRHHAAEHRHQPAPRRGVPQPSGSGALKAYPLILSSRSDFSDVAPYFIEFVRQQMDAQFGSGLYRQGLRIYTTIDLDIQQAAERALSSQLEAIENGAYGKYPHETYAHYIQKQGESGNPEQRSNTPYLQGLLVTIEAKTGTSAPWWEAAISTTASSTGPPRPAGNRGRPSSRSSIRPPSARDIRCPR